MIHPELKLSNLPAFEKCPLEILFELQEKSETITFKPRAVLAESGKSADFVYIVLFGAIKLQNKITEKENVIYHFLSRGDTFGSFINLSPNNSYPCDAIAIDNCGVLKVPAQLFNNIMRRYAPLLQKLWDQMSEQLRDLQLDHAYQKRSVPSRIAEFFLRMHEKQPAVYGNKIRVRLSRKDIASKIGAKPETVIRVLSEWTQNGWIHTEDKFLELLDIESLKRLL